MPGAEELLLARKGGLSVGGVNKVEMSKADWNFNFNYVFIDVL